MRKIKIARNSRCNIMQIERRLDGKCSASAKDVRKRFSRSEKRTLDHGSGSRLSERRIIVADTVSPLMKSVAGGIQSKICRIFIEKNTNDHALPAFIQLTDTEFLHKPFRDRLLDNAARCLDCHEVTLDTFSVHQDV